MVLRQIRLPSSEQPQISSFLGAPIAHEYNNEYLAPPGYEPYRWTSPCATTFHTPLLAQRQLLYEAQSRPPAPPLTRAQRRRLLAALEHLTILDTPAGRDLLLRDLPAALQSNLVRSASKTLDLDAIVEGAARWTPPPGEPAALVLLVENALDLGQGSAVAAELAQLLAEISSPAAPQER